MISPLARCRGLSPSLYSRRRRDFRAKIRASIISAEERTYSAVVFVAAYCCFSAGDAPSVVLGAEYISRYTVHFVYTYIHTQLESLLCVSGHLAAAAAARRATGIASQR